MTTSSNAGTSLQVLDTPLLVYSLLQNHPASSVCSQYIQSQGSWTTSTLVLLESRAILTKVYDVANSQVTQKLAQLSALPIRVLRLDEAAALDAMQCADHLGLDLTDAVLLRLAQSATVSLLATEDQGLTQVCSRIGITTQSPIDSVLRNQIAAWEATNLPLSGLPRVLRRIHDWLLPLNPQTAQDFWSHTGGGSHLP